MDETKPPLGDAGHEHSDVNVRAVTRFAVGLTFGVIAVTFLMWFLFDQFARRDAAREVKPEPMVAANPQKMPPEPRLQKDGRIDLKNFRASEETLINSYGWVDPAKGTVRIPIARAMDLATKEGLK